MVNFDLETANATQLMNEIIRITVTEYNILGEKIDLPCPQHKKEMVEDMMRRYLANERLLDTYFERLKDLLNKSPPSLKELKKKERLVKNIIKRAGGK